MERKSAGYEDARWKWLGATTNARDSSAMCVRVACQRSLSSAVEADRSRHPTRARSGQRHVSPSRSGRRCARAASRERAGRARWPGPDEPLVVGRHEFAVMERESPPATSRGASRTASSAAPGRPPGRRRRARTVLSRDCCEPVGVRASPRATRGGQARTSPRAVSAQPASAFAHTDDGYAARTSPEDDELRAFCGGLRSPLGDLLDRPARSRIAGSTRTQATGEAGSSLVE